MADTQTNEKTEGAFLASFVASRKTGTTNSTGLGMTIDHTGKLCK